MRHNRNRWKARVANKPKIVPLENPGTVYRKNQAMLPSAVGYRSERREVPGLLKPSNPAFSNRGVLAQPKVVHPAVQKPVKFEIRFKG